LKKKPHTNRAGGVAQGVGPEFNPQNHKKKKKKKKRKKKEPSLIGSETMGIA
jgi:hypothetical protein